MQCNNATRTGARCYIMHNHKQMQIFIKHELRGSKSITLKTNDGTDIVRRYYFNT
jgi:hypothetical protein